MLSVSAHLIPWAAIWSLRECKCEVTQNPRELHCLPRLKASFDIPSYAFFAQGGRQEPYLVLGAVNRYFRGFKTDMVGKRSYDHTYPYVFPAAFLHIA